MKWLNVVMLSLVLAISGLHMAGCETTNSSGSSSATPSSGGGDATRTDQEMQGIGDDNQMNDNEMNDEGSFDEEDIDQGPQGTSQDTSQDMDEGMMDDGINDAQEAD